jgi:NADH-quinone oxidoreductase subunit B
MRDGSAHAVVGLDSSEDFLERTDGLVGKLAQDVRKGLWKVLGPLLYWGRGFSPWGSHFGIACCSIEVPMAVFGPLFDVERHGVLSPSTARQWDMLWVSGTVTRKLAPRIRILYEQMLEPKWVVAIGDCAISGGPFYDSYNVVKGVDKIMPVDMYVPGCPVRPETFIDAIIEFRRRVREGKR